jgi:hypothetical protein
MARKMRRHVRVHMNKSAMVRLAFFIVLALVVFGDTSYCQINPMPNSNASASPGSRLTLQNDGTNTALMVHRDPLGRSCLDFEAASRKEVINPNVYDHVISVYNRCIQTIKLKVCYYHSDHCIDMSVPGSQRKDAVLGVYPNLQYFRYSYQEKF